MVKNTPRNNIIIGDRQCNAENKKEKKFHTIEHDLMNI